MATDLGTAYVQIAPSAKGIKGKLTEAVGGEAVAAGEAGGKGIASGIVGVLKGALIAAGIGKAIQAALTEGANLQQSFGGLETIYGDAAGAAKDYAYQAAQAGISANDYAEQAVSFGASLKQAFGGDTVKAAEAANTAILDMTDNAAKMGTPIENIQNAYQGFAKQNYTMLDNLKLGYGGTKEEMERLLADAEKLSGQEYDISNLGDVYDAIHVIQEDLGLTGVAAEEASSTFSGSFGAMQAAASNFLANLSTGADVTGPLTQLLQSVGTFLFNNLGPMLGNVLTALPTVLSTLVTTALPMLQTSFSELFTQLQTNLLPDLTANGGGMLEGLMSGLSERLPELLAQAGEMMNSFLASFLEKAPELITTGGQMLGNLVSGLLDALPGLIESAATVSSNFLATVMEHLPEIMSSGVEMLGSLINGIIEKLPDLASTCVDAVGKMTGTFVEHLPDLLNSGIQLMGKVLAGLVEKFPDIVSKVWDFCVDMYNKFIEYDWLQLGKDILLGIKDGLVAAGDELITAILGVAEGAFEAVKKFFGIASPSKLMRDEVGKMLAEGMAIGFEDNIPTSEIEAALQPMAGIVPSAMGSQYNYGGFSINVYQQPGQDTNALVDMIETRINGRIQNRRAVFA